MTQETHDIFDIYGNLMTRVYNDVPQETVNERARLYLNSTDWYIARFTETGTPIPQDVLQKRKEARLSIVTGAEMQAYMDGLI